MHSTLGFYFYFFESSQTKDFFEIDTNTEIFLGNMLNVSTHSLHSITVRCRGSCSYKQTSYSLAILEYLAVRFCSLLSSPEEVKNAY